MKKKLNLKTRKKKSSEKEESHPENIVNSSLQKLSSVTTDNSYLSFSGTQKNFPVTGNIVFNRTATIKNLGKPINDTDSVTPAALANELNHRKSLFIPKNEDCSLNGFSMEGNSIFSYKNASENSDPITTKQLNEILCNYISIDNKNSEEMITGDLIFNGNSVIKNFISTGESGDPVKISDLDKQLREISEKLVSKNNCILKGNLDLDNHSISDVGNPSQDSDGISISFFKELKQNFPATNDNTNQTFYGNLAFDKQSLIKNIPEHQNASDALNMEECLSIIRESQNEFLDRSGGSVTGLFNLNQHAILKLGNPLQNTDLLNTATLSSMLEPYISYQGNNISNPITGDLVLDNQKIRNIRESAADNEAISYGEIKKIISSKKSRYLSKNNTSLSNSFRISGHRILNLGDPTEISSAVNFRILQKTIKDSIKNIIQTSGNSSMKGDIHASGFSILGLSNPLEENDGVNLIVLERTTEAYKNDFIPLTGGKLSGNLSLPKKKITGLTTPLLPQDIVNVSYLKSAFLNCTSLSSTNKSNPCTKNLIFTGTFKLKGLSEPKNGEDSVSWGYLQKRTENMIPLEGNSEENPLTHMKLAEGFRIKNLGDCTESSEILNLRSLQKYISDFSSLLVSKTGNIFLEGELDMNGNGILELGSSEEEADLINFSDLEKQASDLIDFKGQTANIKGDLTFENGKLVLLSDPIAKNEPFNKKFLDNSLKNYILSNSSAFNPIQVDIKLGTQYTVKFLEEPNSSKDAVNLKTALEVLKKHISPLLQKNGGTVDGDLNLSQIKNLKDPEQPGDPVKLKNVLNSVKSTISLSEQNEEVEIIGNLIFQSPAKIEGLPDPKSPLEILNLRTCKSILKGYINITQQGTPIKIGKCNGNFKYKPTGLPNPKKTADAMNFITLKSLISQMEKLYVLRNKKSDMKGPLNLKENKITEITSPVNLNDGVNLKYLNEYLKNFLNFTSNYDIACNINCSNIATIKDFQEESNPSGALSLEHLNKIKENFVSITYDQNTIEMKGNIVCGQRASCNGLSHAQNPSEVLPFEQLKTLFSSDSLMPISGGSMKGDLIFEDSGITNMGNSSLLYSAVNLLSLKQKITSYLSISGNTPSSPLTVNLVFNGQSTIEDLPEAMKDEDLANLNDLKKEIENLQTLFLSETDLILDGDLNMNGNIIRKVRDAVLDHDGVNLKTLKQFSENFIPDKSESPITISGSLYLDENSRVFLRKKPIKESDAVNKEHLLKLIKLRKTEFISLNNNSNITGNLKLDGVITELGEPQQDTDAVNIAFAEYMITSSTEDLISDSGGTLKGNLIIEGSLNGLASPEHNEDAVTLKELNDGLAKLKNQLLPESGGALKGNLTAMLITGIPEAIQDQHPTTFAAALAKTQEAYQNLLPIKTTESTSNLRMGGHKITNVAPSEDSGDAVNLEEMIHRLQEKLPLKNRTPLHKISSIWNLNDHIIEKHCDASNGLDGLNLKILKQQLNILSASLLPVAGGIISGELNLNGYKIKNIGDPVSDMDGISLKNLKNYFSQFLKIQSESPVIIKSHILGNNRTISIFSSAEKENDLMNRASCKQIINTKKSEMASRDSEIKMQGNMFAQTIINLPDPISNGDAVNYSYLKKNLEKESILFLPKEFPTTMKGNIDLNFHEVIATSPNNSESSGVNLRTASEKTQEYLSDRGCTLLNSLTITGKVSGIPNPKMDSDLVNLQFAISEL